MFSLIFCLIFSTLVKSIEPNYCDFLNRKLISINKSLLKYHFKAPVNEGEVYNAVFNIDNSSSTMKFFHRPVRNVRTTVEVTVSFYFHSLLEIVEKFEELTIQGYLDIVSSP